jgi:hypothetical protein
MFAHPGQVVRDDGIVLDDSFAAPQSWYGLAGDLPQPSNGRTVKGLLTQADLEPIILRRIVGSGDHDASFHLELEEGEIEEGSGTNP